MQVLLPAVLNPSGLLSVLSGRPARTFGTVHVVSPPVAVIRNPTGTVSDTLCHRALTVADKHLTKNHRGESQDRRGFVVEFSRTQVSQTIRRYV